MKSEARLSFKQMGRIEYCPAGNFFRQLSEHGTYLQQVWKVFGFYSKDYRRSPPAVLWPKETIPALCKLSMSLNPREKVGWLLVSSLRKNRD